MAFALRNNHEKLAAFLPPLLIESERVAESVWHGTHGRRRAGRGDSFWQFRRYDAGDPVTRIDWRQSARTDRLYVREREWEAAQTTCLWADMSGSMHYASNKNIPSKAEEAKLLMLALASLLLRGGEKVLWGEGEHLTPLNGKPSLERAASTDLHNQTSVPPLPAHHRRAHMILASDFLMPQEVLLERMRTYAAQNLHGVFLHIIDPLEASFELDGRVELQGTEGEKSHLVPNAAALRHDYRQRFEAHENQLRHMAESAGWFYLRHLTSDSAQATLLRLYQYLAG